MVATFLVDSLNHRTDVRETLRNMLISDDIPEPFSDLAVKTLDLIRTALQACVMLLASLHNLKTAETEQARRTAKN